MADKGQGSSQEEESQLLERRSERSTKGQHGPRYGFSEPTTSKKAAEKTNPTPVTLEDVLETRGGSVGSIRSFSSRRSVTSTSSSARRALLSAQLEKKKELEEERQKLENERLAAEAERLTNEAQVQAQIQSQKLAVQERKLKEKGEIADLELEILKEDLEEDLQSNHSQDLSDDEEIDQSKVKRSNKNIESNPNVGSTSAPQDLTEAMTFMADTVSQLAMLSGGRRDGGDSKFLARQTLGKELPIFAGNPEEWVSFETEYWRTTEACGFTSAENLGRLRKCLRGKAKEVVMSTFAASNNSDEVMEMLKDQFGRNELIIKSLVTRVRDIPPVKEGKVDTMVTLSNSVKSLAVTLHQLGEVNHLCNPMLLEEVKGKLPLAEQKEWARHLLNVGVMSPSLSDFSRWLELETKVITKAGTIDINSWRSSTDEKGNRRTQPFSGTVEEERNASNSGGHGSGQNKCLFCTKGVHALTKCYKFKTATQPVRWRWIRDKRCCFCCLEPGHDLRGCKKLKTCDVGGCKAQHNKLLHRDEKEEAPRIPDPEEEVPEVTLHSFGESEVLLKVIPVKVHGPRGTIFTHALLDDGSSVTMVDSRLVEEAGLTGTPRPLNLSWWNNRVDTDQDSIQLDINISGVEDGAKVYTLKKARTVQNMSLRTQSLDFENLKKRWPHLKKVKAGSLEEAKPTILIGSNNWDLQIPRKTVFSNKDGPAAVKTLLGWTVYGTVPGSRRRSDFSLFVSNVGESPEDQILHELVKDSFKTESFGVLAVEAPKSKHEVRARHLLETTTKRNGEFWETGLLWRKDDITLPESRSMATRRMTCMERKMDKDSEFSSRYHEKINEYILKGFVRKLTREEEEEIHPRTWYIPHFGVIQPNKPGKLRFIFDAASKSHGMSLNDALMKGPDLFNSLAGVLWKFREKKIGFCGDIQDMFHRVKIRREDCHSQRFLWRGQNRSGDFEIYEMTSMTFGSTCSPASATYVMRRNAEEFQDEFPKAVQAIIHHHYVDDYPDCEDSEESAVQLIKDVVEVHRRGNFHIKKWTSSSKDVLSQIPDDLRADGTRSLETSSELAQERILGMQWNPNSDTFSFDLRIDKLDKVLNGKDRPTKRQVLRVVMSIFDPLGFLSNYVVQAKVLLQDIWRSGVGWDDQLTSELNNKWIQWSGDLEKVKSLKIPRWHGLVSGLRTDVHIFCDASEKAFAVVSYFVQGGDNVDSTQVSFIGAKTRVSPLKPMSIPRLELQAAVMGARFAETIMKEHRVPIGRTIFWTDSMTVIQWVRSDARNYKQFVSHRIGEILERSQVDNWRWLPSRENVADEATKRVEGFNFDPDSRWIKGPSFLKLPESQWPREEKKLTPDEEKLEIRTVLFVQVKEEDGLPKIEGFSKWLCVIRATAWMYRFIRRSRKINGPDSQELTVEEVERAESIWIRKCQIESFPDEVKRLKTGKPVDSSSRILTLSPFLDRQGLMRLRGRIGAVKGVDETTKFPVILDPKSRFVELLVMHYHLKAGHQGQELVLNELRQKYWILNGRQVVKKAWRTCDTCKFVRSRVQVPEMGSLPHSRLDHHVPAFTHTGLDYFGPMVVTVGRRHEKRYGALFTCLVTRAVHIELAHSLTTDSCLMALRRFTGRRGCPKEIWSDNGTNFIGADRELREALKGLDQVKIQESCTTKGIQWNFIPPSAPHFGGSWERKVRSIKSALNVTLKERYPKEEVLMTLLVEAEHLVNSHPLTPVSLDSSEEEALTPNHFLIGRSSGVPAFGTFSDSDLIPGKQWRLAQRLTDCFWSRWIKEYLPTLVKRTKWFKPDPNLKVGDLVLIVDMETPRDAWVRGIIKRTFPGKDGIVRSVEVKTGRGSFIRPVAKVIVLEVKSD